MPLEQHEQYKRELILQQRRIRLYQLTLLLLLLGAWEVASTSRLIDPLLFSSPTAVLQLSFAKLLDGSLLPHAIITLAETVVGFLLGTLLGTLLATFLWASDTSARVLDPFLVVLNAMPKVALGPIILVLFGPNMLAIVMMGVLISIIISTLVIYSAFRQVDVNYMKVLTMLQATKRQQFQHAILPACLPTIISTLKVNVGLAWVGVIVGEFLVASKGLGYLIISGFQVFNFHLVYVALFIILLLAACMYKTVEIVERALLKTFHF